MVPRLKYFFLLLAIQLVLFIPNLNAQTFGDTQRIEAALRRVGHQVLLQAGDSTSKVLPIEHIDNQFKISFENAFEFHPGPVAAITHEIVRESSIASNSIIEVKLCGSQQVVYSVELTPLFDLNTIPCANRNVEKGCFELWFTILSNQPFPELSEQEVQKAAESSSNKKGILWWIVLVIPIGIGSWIWMKQRSEEVKEQGVFLGKYQMDKVNMLLVHDDEKIELSNKEFELLHLLYKHVNSTVEREVLLKEVWGDEGDYIGRTLDVFVSKLRKKLSGDASLKIINIRGVGYKFIVSSE